MKTKPELLMLIKSFRIQRNYNQSEFSELIGMSQSAYSKLEKGITELTYDRYFQLVKILDIPLELLFKSTSKEKKERFEELIHMNDIELSRETSIQQINKFKEELTSINKKASL